MKKLIVIFMYYLGNILNSILKWIPDDFTGSQEKLKEKSKWDYNHSNFDSTFQNYKIAILIKYISILLILCFLVVIFLVSKHIEPVDSISRDNVGVDSECIPLQITADNGTYKIEKQVTFHLNEKTYSKDEDRQRIELFLIDFDTFVLNGNDSFTDVSKPLHLIKNDQRYGIHIDWNCSYPELLHEEKKSYFLDWLPGEKIELEASLKLGEIVEKRTYSILMSDQPSQELWAQTTEYQLEAIVSNVGKMEYQDSISLPSIIGNNTSLKWSTGSYEGMVSLFIFGGIALLYQYFNRYRMIELSWRKTKDQVFNDLPDLIHKLLLLLEAGFVVSAAFKRITLDYEKSRIRNGKHRYLYDSLLEIQKKVDESQYSFITELKNLSQQLGLRELIRFTAIISDNWNRGSGLSSKLEIERELMWLARKKKAEEKGKIAESKLVFPMMLLLIVLIMITTAPALLEIN